MANEFKGRAGHSAEHFGDSRDYWWNLDFLRLMAKRWRLDAVRDALDVGCGGYHLGSSVAVLPDLDGDDRQEIVLAAPDAPFACVERAGRVLVLNCTGR